MARIWFDIASWLPDKLLADFFQNPLQSYKISLIFANKIIDKK